MDDQQHLVNGEDLKSRLTGPVGGIIKDCCSGTSLTAILNCFLLMLILVVLAIISIQSRQPGTQQIGSAVAQVCPPPYVPVMGECFYIQNIFTFNFEKAAEYCSTMGGHLAEPKTASTLLSYQVDALGPLRQRQSYWIGGSDADGDGQFNWLSGRPVHKSEWQQGMPSETHWNRKCLRYYLAGNQCGVADGNCDDGMNVICEYPVN
ncbi:unnamed protein product [Meganyctiphanes norvegica]|uniref:C-type lectin domain-containing protein n=1 Tax=Meganyctiphanes norvegica TaxID=48144 RepID=A0AAV2RC01_MEGNR